MEDFSWKVEITISTALATSHATKFQSKTYFWSYMILQLIYYYFLSANLGFLFPNTQSETKRFLFYMYSIIYTSCLLLFFFFFFQWYVDASWRGHANQIYSPYMGRAALDRNRNGLYGFFFFFDNGTIWFRHWENICKQQ